jgi:hypothetical protein
MATTTAISFLAAPDEVRRDLLAEGFQIVFVRDHSAALAAGLPSVMEWQINVMRSLVEGRLAMIEALARKPAWIRDSGDRSADK